jgi:hypothetical protein
LVSLSSAAVPALSSVLNGELSPVQAERALDANAQAAASNPDTILQNNDLWQPSKT